MNKLLFLLAVMALLCFPIEGALAQRSDLPERFINPRVEQLRERMENYENRQSLSSHLNKLADKKSFNQEPLIESEIEAAEKNLNYKFNQQLADKSARLEEREDVSITVLYKDPEYSQDSQIAIAAESTNEVKPVDTDKQENATDTRLQRYEELRQRVRLATKSSQETATEISRLFR